MPFDEDDRKWACEPCIRGHRSSKCDHYDRVMMRVKGPGRPLSTCPHGENSKNCYCSRGEMCFMIQVRLTEEHCVCRIKQRVSADRNQTPCGPRYNTDNSQKGGLFEIHPDDQGYAQSVLGHPPPQSSSPANPPTYTHGYPPAVPPAYSAPLPAAAAQPVVNGANFAIPYGQQLHYQDDSWPSNGMMQQHGEPLPTLMSGHQQDFNDPQYQNVMYSYHQPSLSSQAYTDTGMQPMLQHGMQNGGMQHNMQSHIQPGMHVYSQRPAGPKRCGCGTRCNCVFCPEHPHNNASTRTVLELMDHMQQELNLNDSDVNTAEGSAPTGQHALATNVADGVATDLSAQQGWQISAVGETAHGPTRQQQWDAGVIGGDTNGFTGQQSYDASIVNGDPSGFAYAQPCCH